MHLIKLYLYLQHYCIYKFIELNKLFTYQKIIATLFLVIYFYLLIPTKLWHSHSEHEAEQKKIANKTTVFADRLSCSICDNHISVFNSVLIFEPVFLFIKPTKWLLMPFILEDYSHFVISQSNKGPPHFKSIPVLISFFVFNYLLNAH